MRTTAWRSSPQIRRFYSSARQVFSKLSFLLWHHLWFMGTCFVTSIILWATARESQPLRYVDALFLTTSAMSEAGLTTVGLASLRTFHQAVLFFLIFIGSAVFVSCAIIQLRKRSFDTKLQELARHRHSKILRLRDIAHQHATMTGCQRVRLLTDIGDALNLWDLPNTEDEGIVYSKPRINLFGQSAALTSSRILFKPDPAHVHLTSNSGLERHSQDQSSREPVQRRPECENHPKSPLSLPSPSMIQARDRNNLLKTTLSGEERDQLGGIEYRSLKLLAWIVPLYVLCFQLFGCIGCGAYLHLNRPDVAAANDMNSFWTGAFFAVSAFNNNGMALNDANMSALQTSCYMLLTLSLLILAGNTCFPPFLRLVVWTLKECVTGNTRSERVREWQTVLGFILNHPRRLYTHLFPSEATWWLVLSLIIINGILWFAFEVLNITNPAVTNIPPKYRVLDGLFQAFAVRKGGFFVVPMSNLYPGTLTLYIVMMYVNALPIQMAMVTTSKYEEQSLEINPGEEIATVTSRAGEEAVVLPIKSTRISLFFRTRGGVVSNTTPSHQTYDLPQEPNSSLGRFTFVRDQLHGKITHDLWWITLAVLLITIIETASVRLYPDVFSVFNIAFEVVSGWGTVGVSTGLPWDVSSFCGAWHTGSKLILIALMARGRHVGLPGAIDCAILLPEVSLAWSRAQDIHIECDCGHYTDDTTICHGSRSWSCGDPSNVPS